MARPGPGRDPVERRRNVSWGISFEMHRRSAPWARSAQWRGNMSRPWALLRRWFATYARLDDARVTRFPLRAREPRDRWRIRWVFPMQGHAMLEERQTTIESAPLQRDEIGRAHV